MSFDPTDDISSFKKNTQIKDKVFGVEYNGLDWMKCIFSR